MISSYIGGSAESQKSNLRKFIEIVYDSDIIFPQKEKRTNECFLRGTFVFEDNDSNMFKMLYNCEHTQSFWKTTHSEVKKKNTVDASLRLEGTISMLPVKESWIDEKNKEGILKKLYQYEVKLEPPFEYSCNKECRVDSPPTECSEALKDPKGVALLYHFRIKATEEPKATDKPKVIERAYTFLKLEGHYSLSLGHSVSAIARYGFNKDGKPANLPSRREDCGQKCEFKGKSFCDTENKDSCLLYNEKNDYHITNFKEFKLAAPEMAVNIDKSIDIYSNHVRTGDELFVPQDITNALLISTDPQLMLVEQSGVKL